MTREEVPDTPWAMVVQAASGVLKERGTEEQLVQRLVSAYGDAKALEMLASYALGDLRLLSDRATIALALGHTSEWQNRRSCPTCGDLCGSCLEDRAADLRDALEDIPTIDDDFPAGE